MPISVPSTSTTSPGVQVHIELAPSRNVYLTGSILTRVFVSTTDLTSHLLVVPTGVALFMRNPPISTAWATVPLNNDGVGLYHGDVEWEGAFGKGELQAFAYNVSGQEVGGAYTQIYLDRYSA